MKILEPSEISKDTFMKMFLYGPPGEGKTFFACNHSLRNAYICTEWEQARATWQVLADRGVINTESRVFQVESMEDLREVTRYLLNYPGRFDVVVLDNLTDVQDFIKAELLLSDKKRDLSVLSISEWQILVDKTIAILKAFRDIPDTHFICIGHFGENYDDRQQRFIRPSMLGKSLPSRVSACMNVLGYLHTEVLSTGLRREIIFAGASNILTKPHSSLRNVEYANLEFLIAKMSRKIPRTASYLDWRSDMGGNKSVSLSPEELFAVVDSEQRESVLESNKAGAVEEAKVTNKASKTEKEKF